MTVTAEQLLERTARDAAGRLRWRVLGRLGVCPVSLRGRLLSRRAALRLACQLVLDDAARSGVTEQAVDNPNFDMARFARLARSGRA